jgi:hypothetical protein
VLNSQGPALRSLSVVTEVADIELLPSTPQQPDQNSHTVEK